MLFVPERRRSRRRPSAIRARDVRAADLQEEPTNPADTADLPRQSFRRIRRRRRLLSEQRSEPSDTASLASGAINTDQEELERRRSAWTATWRSVVCHMSGIEACRYAP